MSPHAAREGGFFMPEGHSLLLAFDSSDSEFCRGFEAGRMWTLVGEREEEVSEMVHASNTEMLMRIAEATDRPFRAELVDETWVEITFEPMQVCVDAIQSASARADGRPGGFAHNNHHRIRIKASNTTETTNTEPG